MKGSYPKYVRNSNYPIARKQTTHLKNGQDLNRHSSKEDI
jgi:hypothetical protein